jgi:hypothetical protein
MALFYFDQDYFQFIYKSIILDSNTIRVLIFLTIINLITNEAIIINFPNFLINPMDSHSNLSQEKMIPIKNSYGSPVIF